MRLYLALLLIALSADLFACSPDVDSEYELSVSFYDSQWLVGESAAFAVAVVRKGPKDPPAPTIFYSPNYVTPDLTIENLTCTPGCEAKLVEGPRSSKKEQFGEVTASTAGFKTVSMTIRTSDGETRDRSVEIRFYPRTTRIVAHRKMGISPDGATSAMLHGDSQVWTLALADDEGPAVGGLDAIAAGCTDP